MLLPVAFWQMTSSIPPDGKEPPLCVGKTKEREREKEDILPFAKAALLVMSVMGFTSFHFSKEESKCKKSSKIRSSRN